jgi:hypothetical protein
MEVAKRAVEQKATNARENGVSQVLVQKGHGARPYPALKTIAHHKLGSGTEFVQEDWNRSEIIAVVGVTYQNVLAACGCDSAHEGTPVPLDAYVDNTGTHPLRDLDGAITAAIVRYDHLACNIGLPENALCFADTRCQSFRLVQTRHHHREFERFRLIWRLGNRLML